MTLTGRLTAALVVATASTAMHAGPADARAGAATITASADSLEADLTVALTVRGTAPPVVAPDDTG